MLDICKFIRILSKIFSAPQAKDNFLFKDLCCHIPSYLYYLTGNLVNSYLTSTVEQTHQGPVVSFFPVKILECLLQIFIIHRRYPFLLLLMMWCGYASNYNAQGAFVIIFYICSDLLNCLRSVCTIVITIGNGLNSLKVISTKKIVTESSHFSLFWCISCTATSETCTSSSSKNISNTARVFRLSFRFL